MKRDILPRALFITGYCLKPAVLVLAPFLVSLYVVHERHTDKRQDRKPEPFGKALDTNLTIFCDSYVSYLPMHLYNKGLKFVECMQTVRRQKFHKKR